MDIIQKNVKAFIHNMKAAKWIRKRLDKSLPMDWYNRDDLLELARQYEKDAAMNLQILKSTFVNNYA
jgi:hypothetical protein